MSSACTVSLFNVKIQISMTGKLLEVGTWGDSPKLIVQDVWVLWMPGATATPSTTAAELHRFAAAWHSHGPGVGKQHWLCVGKTWIIYCFLIMFGLWQESTRQSKCSDVPHLYRFRSFDICCCCNGPQIPPSRFLSGQTWFLTWLLLVEASKAQLIHLYDGSPYSSFSIGTLHANLMTRYEE